MTGFGEIDKKMSVFGPKWAIFDSFCPGKAKTGFFLGKSENVTSVNLLCRNFVQKTRTNL